MSAVRMIAATILAAGLLAGPAQAAIGFGGLAGEGAGAPRIDAQSSKTMTVKAKTANLRAGPGVKNKKLAALPQGTQVEVVGSQGKWTQVKVRDQTGYVSTRLLR